MLAILIELALVPLEFNSRYMLLGAVEDVERFRK